MASAKRSINIFFKETWFDKKMVNLDLQKSYQPNGRGLNKHK